MKRDGRAGEVVGDGEAECEADRGRHRPEHHRVPKYFEVVEVGIEDCVEVVPDREPGREHLAGRGVAKAHHDHVEIGKDEEREEQPGGREDEEEGRVPAPSAGRRTARGAGPDASDLAGIRHFLPSGSPRRRTPDQSGMIQVWAASKEHRTSSPTPNAAHGSSCTLEYEAARAGDAVARDVAEEVAFAHPSRNGVAPRSGGVGRVGRVGGSGRRQRDGLGTDDEGHLPTLPQRSRVGAAKRTHRRAQPEFPVVARPALNPAFHEVREADEARHLAAHRPRIDLVGRPHLVDAPVEHDHDAVGDHHRFGLIVGHVDGRDPDPLLQRPDEETHLLAELRVEVGQGLVQQEDARLDDHGPGEGDALLLAAGELAGLALPEVAELHRLQDPGDAFGGLVLRDAPHLEPRTRGSGAPSCGGRGRSSGTPCRCSAARGAAPPRRGRRTGSGPPSAPRTPRCTAGSSSCRSPTGRGGRRARGLRSGDRTRPPRRPRRSAWRAPGSRARSRDHARRARPRPGGRRPPGPGGTRPPARQAGGRGLRTGAGADAPARRPAGSDQRISLFQRSITRSRLRLAVFQS